MQNTNNKIEMQYINQFTELKKSEQEYISKIFVNDINLIRLANNQTFIIALITMFNNISEFCSNKPEKITFTKNSEKFFSFLLNNKYAIQEMQEFSTIQQYIKKEGVSYDDTSLFISHLIMNVLICNKISIQDFCAANSNYTEQITDYIKNIKNAYTHINECLCIVKACNLLSKLEHIYCHTLTDCITYYKNNLQQISESDQQQSLFLKQFMIFCYQNLHAEQSDEQIVAQQIVKQIFNLIQSAFQEKKISLKDIVMFNYSAMYVLAQRDALNISEIFTNPYVERAYKSSPNPMSMIIQCINCYAFLTYQDHFSSMPKSLYDTNIISFRSQVMIAHQKSGNDDFRALVQRNVLNNQSDKSIKR